MENCTDAIMMNDFQLRLYKIFLENPTDIFGIAQLQKKLKGEYFGNRGFSRHEMENLKWLCEIGAVKAEPYYGHTVYSLSKPVNYKLFTYSWEWGNPLTIYEELYVNDELVSKQKYEGEFLNEL